MPKTMNIKPAMLEKRGKISFEDIPVNSYNKTVAKAGYSNEELIRMYRDITILREFEHMLNQIKTQGVYNGVETTYPGPAHLSLGQEAAAVGQAYLLGQNDIVY